MRKVALVLLAVMAGTFLGSNAVAQEGSDSQLRWEIHGGVGFPTFDIADAAKIGPLGGAGVWFLPAEARWRLGIEADFGFHGGEDVTVGTSTVTGPDVNVYHFMGKAGYVLYTSADGKTEIMVNAGAGAVMFDVDVAGADKETYLAINAGGKLYRALSPKVDFVISLQGDIAFSDEDVFGASTAWVWPLTVGVAFKI